MEDLNVQLENLRIKYRKIFIKISGIFCKKEDSMGKVKFLNYLNEKYSKDIYKKKIEIDKYRKDFNCKGCGACCKLACSEFSYEELQQKAKNGDSFAKQFVSVFIPYKTEAEAKKQYLEYFELLKIQNQNENVYFYHCPKVTTDNRCSDYENRPQICRDFPDNPLGIFPKTCGYKAWGKKAETKALILRSALEIVGFYKAKISKIKDN